MSMCTGFSTPALRTGSSRSYVNTALAALADAMNWRTAASRRCVACGAELKLRTPAFAALTDLAGLGPRALTGASPSRCGSGL